MNELTVIVPNRLNELSREINAIYQAAIFEIGERLLEAKSLLPHGQFIPWVKANCPFARHQANDYMRVTKRKGEFEELPVSLIAAVKELRAKDQMGAGAPISKLDKEVQAIERRNEQIIARTSYVQGFIATLDQLDLEEPSPYELALLRGACEKLIRRIDAKGEKQCLHLVALK